MWNWRLIIRIYSHRRFSEWPGFFVTRWAKARATMDDNAYICPVCDEPCDLDQRYRYHYVWYCPVCDVEYRIDAYSYGWNETDESEGDDA
jgi:ribosomal protein L37AE/L43A